MARGAHSPGPAALPKVSFVKVDDDISPKAFGVDDKQQRSYGYNDYSEFHRPEPYIRHIEPLESELNQQVEYDMDEQDQEWLDALNQERKKEQIGLVSYETFEIVMDQLEKEWFNLSKKIPKPDMALPSEDSTCAICDDPEGENTNAIVFCDGCNLAVHQDCYGVPYIPEGQWLCRKCTVSPENPVSCILCPNEGGAFKQTVSSEWVHLLCAIWVPETRVANEVFMEPVTGIEKISKQRWKLRCQLCDIREGACIQCSKTSCFTAFHATCARKDKLLMPMKASSGSEAPTLQCYCEKHLPDEQAKIREAALIAEGITTSQTRSHSHTRENSFDTPPPPATTFHVTHTIHGHINTHPSPKSSKSARAYTKSYKPGPPIVPALIVTRILAYIAKISVRKKSDFVEMVCRYWSLKREARRGAPLLKRLHLEPWTGGSAANGGRVSDEEKAIKLEHMKKLRGDLERIRTLAELCRKRESRKLRQTQFVEDVVKSTIFPHEEQMRNVFDKIVAMDRNDYFKNPVSKADVPDYHDIVKKPMCWNMIEAKLDRHEYWDLKYFKGDIILVLDNAMLYNKPGTSYFKTAHRIKGSSEALLAELNGLATSAPFELSRLQLQHPTDPQPPLPTAKAEISSSETDETRQPDASVQQRQPSEDPSHSVSQSEFQLQSLPLQQLQTSTSIPSHSSFNTITTMSSLANNSIGNLEPPLSFISLLLSSSVVEELQPMSDWIIPSAALPCILSYGHGELVPPPPMPPTPATPPSLSGPAQSRPQSTIGRKRGKSKEATSEVVVEKEGGKEKQKRNYKAEFAKRKERERQRALDSSAGFRASGLRTRRAAAAEEAFEREAAAGVVQDDRNSNTKKLDAWDGTAAQVLGGAALEREERPISVEPDTDLDANGAGPSRTAPTSEAQVEAQVKIDGEVTGEGDVDIDVEIADDELPEAEQPQILPEIEPELSSEQLSVEPPSRSSPFVEAEHDAMATVALAKQKASALKRNKGNASTKRKRPSYAPNQPPAVVQDIGKKDAFLNFESGWILPQGHRRGGRKAPEIMWPLSAKKGEPATKRAKRTHASDASGSRATASIAPTDTTDGVKEEMSAVPPPEVQGAGSGKSTNVDALTTDTSTSELFEFAAELEPLAVGNPSSLHSPTTNEPSPSPGAKSRLWRSAAQHLRQAPSLSPDSGTPPVILEPDTALVTDGDGRVVLEVLDTPKTRRERYMRKRGPKTAGNDNASGMRQAGLLTIPLSEPVAGPSYLRVSTLLSMAGEDESELSALSESERGNEENMEMENAVEQSIEEPVEEFGVQLAGKSVENLSTVPPEESVVEPVDESKTSDSAGIVGQPVEEFTDFGFKERSVPEAAPTQADDHRSNAGPSIAAEAAIEGRRRRSSVRGEGPKKGPRKRRAGDGTGDLTADGIIRLEKRQYLEGGTLVWAKSPTYPWWPAVVFEPDDDSIPENILELHPNRPEKLHLVRFYDRTLSWQWLPLQSLFMLGDNKELDEEFLRNSKRQKFKSNNLKAECSAAYQRAVAEMEM